MRGKVDGDNSHLMNPLLADHALLRKRLLAAFTVAQAHPLVLHGWKDPITKPSGVLDFAQEMTTANADWQLHTYGHAMHAFSFIGADIPALGIKYNEKAHRRSEKATLDFLNEIFG